MLNDRDLRRRREGRRRERSLEPGLAAPTSRSWIRGRDDTRAVRDPKRKRLPINKKPAYLSVVFHADRIDYRSGLRRLRMEPARSPFPSSFPPLAGLSFVKLDNLVPSLRAITLDYFCLQSCAPPYTYSLEMIGVELEKENNAWGKGRESEKERRRDRREIERSSVHFRLIAGRESQRVISCACSRKFKLGN